MPKMLPSPEMAKFQRKMNVWDTLNIRFVLSEFFEKYVRE